MSKYQLVIIPATLSSGNKVVIEHPIQPSLLNALRPLMSNGLMIGKKMVITRVLQRVVNDTLEFNLLDAGDNYIGKAIVQVAK